MMASTQLPHKPQMQLVHAYASFSTLSRRQPAQYICTACGLVNMGDELESIEFGFMMWNCEPDESALF